MKAAATKKTASVIYELKPGITNPDFWRPERLPIELRNKILERDDYTCCFCGHRALKWMNVHHKSSTDNSPDNLQTLCVACHAVLHIGLNLQYGAIEIWKGKIPQIEIVRNTRKGVAGGKSLSQIKKAFLLKKGPYPPNSIKYADDLIQQIGNSPRAYLQEDLRVVFVKLERWQLEE
jgi:hypothetical protein